MMRIKYQIKISLQPNIFNTTNNGILAIMTRLAKVNWVTADIECHRMFIIIFLTLSMIVTKW